MTTNLEKYKVDLEKLIKRSDELYLALLYKCDPEQFKKKFGKDASETIKCLPSFDKEYQTWFSESSALIRQLLPDRLDDFRKHYEKPKSRKEITFENYRIEDCLQGLVVTTASGKILASTQSAIPHFDQQVAILKAVKQRFESSLFDIRQLVQADLFDREVDAARELAKNGFLRGAGAVAGVVLEKHLAQVCENHGIKPKKSHPTISDFNDQLKASFVIDTPVWRGIQRLGDIRNMCDHGKGREPTKEEVSELIDGVDKTSKTLF